ncbi:hypothetical protein DNI29_10585 [Hymenobacter sediminis]|uniref:hypothetical protein n=1 Tax=Hymenobacter sediminis TaxID=2218621 RepID=UPI000DA6715E|nr:hypothetical protein [Hymenobacter sediminis]RPD47875.1 hypothetical protein DNI29_10585 [Hymenobacter sediminis]
MPKPLPFLLFLLTLVAACESKKTEDPAPTAPLTDSIKLNELQLQGDSVANLTWSALNNPDFVEYRVIRKESPTEPTKPEATFPIRAQFIGRHRDVGMPYTGYVQYQVVGVLSSGRTIESNIVTHRRPGVQSVEAFTFDVQYDSQSRSLFFFDKRGTIRRFSVESGQVKDIQVGQTIGYGSLSSYQGRQELYVPCQDGRILIYDAATLTKLDELDTHMGQLTDVVANNNQLFVSSTYYSFGSPLKAFDRATKAEVSQGDWRARSGMRLKKIPGTNTSLISLTLSSFPTDQVLFRFSPAGSLLSSQNDLYHSDYPLDSRLFEFSPTGDWYVTGSQGAVYSRSMTYLTSLPRSGNREFTCFGFDAEAQTLYAGTSGRAVEVFSLNDYRRLRTWKTRQYPYKLFKDGNRGFISVSTPIRPDYYQYDDTYYPGKMVIEHLD